MVESKKKRYKSRFITKILIKWVHIYIYIYKQTPWIFLPIPYINLLAFPRPLKTPRCIAPGVGPEEPWRISPTFERDLPEILDLMKNWFMDLKSRKNWFDYIIIILQSEAHLKLGAIDLWQFLEGKASSSTPINLHAWHLRKDGGAFCLEARICWVVIFLFLMTKGEEKTWKNKQRQTKIPETH